MFDVQKLEKSLKRASSRGEFVAVCREVYTPDVKIDQLAAFRYADSLKIPEKINSKSDYLTPGNRIEDDFIELAVSTVLQGGYLYAGEDGQVKKWEIGGSGAKALLSVMDKVRADHLLPALHVRDPQIIRERLSDIFNGVPYGAERLNIWAELAQPETSHKFFDILADARLSPGDHYQFTFDHIRALGKASPHGFGEDPFMKKAALLPVLFAAVAHHKMGPDSVSMDIVAPSDYRVPQTLHNLGILRYSDALVDTLNQGVLLKQSDPYVAQIRLKTVDVLDDLLQNRPDLQLFHVNGELWSAGRLFDKDPATMNEQDLLMRKKYETVSVGSFPMFGFRNRAHLPMNVDTMRF